VSEVSFPGGLSALSAWLFLTILLVGVALLLPGCAADAITTSTAGPQVVKIGALFPLTGDLSIKGESALRGMRLAVEDVNGAGGIGALGGALLTIVSADTKGEAASGDAEIERLVKAEGVAAVVGTAQSTVALRATEVAERLELPFVVSTGAADEITERNLRYTFRLCPKADWYARDQVAFLSALKDLAGLEIRSVALLHEDGPYGRQTAESQKAYLAEAGIHVVADLEYSPEQADVHNEILEIKGSGAEALLTATFLSDAALIAKDMAVLHVRIPVVDAAGGVLAPGFVAEAGEAGEKMMTVAEFAQGNSASSSLEWALRGSDAFLDADSLYGYQAVWLLAAALEQAGSTDGPPLQAAMRTLSLSGDRLVLPQGVLAFEETGQNRDARLLVMQMQEGRLVTVWPEEYAHATVRLP
jgi:branched-chain amino acid transport system substrate-binding protein